MTGKIAIIGSGALATAMGLVLTDSNHKDIIVYGVNGDELSQLGKGLNTNYFPRSISLPKFTTTSNLKVAVAGARYIFLAVPSQVVAAVFTKILVLLDRHVIIVNGAKGFYPDSNFLIHSGLVQASRGHNYVEGIVSITGPSHAEEIVLKHPTLVAIVGWKMNINKQIYNLFQTSYFKTYIQEDVIGVEVGAAYKNVLAIASGLSSGLGYGVNSCAAIITRGLLEMASFNKAMQGKSKTMYGLTGLGDLIATATSELSRNFRYGKSLVKSKHCQVSPLTVEGLVALKYVYRIGQTKKLSLPIAYALYNIIFNNGDITTEFQNLWRSNKIFE